MRTITKLRRTIRQATPALALGTAVLTAALAACSDSPTGPTQPATATMVAAFQPGVHPAITQTPANVTTLMRTAPLPSDVVVQVTVNPGGGNVVNIPGTDAQINFPIHAVSKPTTFTITARAGNVIAYDFQPAGTFSSPVVITQRLQNTNWAGTAVSNLQGAYVQDWSQVSGTTSSATVNEFEPTTFDTKANAVVINVSHFSGYLVSTGRQ